MPKKKRTQKNLKNIIIFIIAIALVFMVVLMLSIALDNIDAVNSRIEEESAINVVINTEEIVKSENEEELNKLKQMTERNRIEYYVSQFIKDIEEGKIDDAYDVLNKDFKQNYFSTKKDFKEYCDKTFTKMIDVNYTNFERNGQIYVIWLTLTDAINGKKDEGKEINFVVKESNFNEFELSFSVN